MLRALVLLLFLANLLFYLWIQGWLTSVVGVQPGGQHEPERMARQVHPEAVRVLPPESASAAASGASGVAESPVAASAASGPADVASAAFATASSVATAASVVQPVPGTLACLEAGPYSLAERIQVEGKLKTVLKPGDWMDVTRERPGIWMVYMGRYATEELLRKKVDEIKRIHLDYTVVNAPAELAWGLSLGRYEVRADADAALAKLTQRGVRSARLVPVRPTDSGHFLRVLRADGAMQTALDGLPAATWLGQRLKPCGSVEP
ncbi:SPOR domain-containing protein [Aquabacterium sp.]|uniref:SPOR domain-containing protein n=1 Tax=Aquabacterium sp. TaxID=1872578 RepID=UPI0035B2E24E